ncbi:MAG: ATP-binding protein [Alphaproteobacteria bacterium]
MSLKETKKYKDEKIVNDALLASALICDADEACLYLKQNESSYQAAFNWRKNDIDKNAELPEIISHNQLFWCLNQLVYDNEIFIGKIGDLNEKAPSDLATLEASRVGAFAMFPVFCNNSLDGVFALYKYGNVKNWKEGEKSFLRMVASVFSLQATKNNAVRQHQKLEKELAQQQKITNNISKYFEHLKMAVIITDRDGYIEYVNPEFTQITGYTFDDVEGKKPSILKSGGMGDDVYQELWQTIKSGKCWRGEFLNKRKDGNFFWQDSRISPIFDEKKNLTHFIAFNDDISEVRTLREKLQKDLNEKSEFISFISHEIRNPLNGIFGLANTLLETKLDNTQKDTVDTIIASCNSLEKILSDVLDLSKIESKQMKVDQVDFDLKLLLEGILKLMKPYASQKNIGLAINIKNDVYRFLNGDPHKIRQIIINIINNAIKFTEKGGITITVENCEQNNKGHTLLFKIKDTGIGMVEEEGAKIFKAFSQADAAITSKYGGTGLGLAICQNLINIMGGEIGFETSANNGSFFWFKLPLKEASSKVKLVVENDFDTPEPYIKPLEILLAEDDPINVKVALNFLGKRGHNITVVHNGEDAVGAVFSNDFDLILMDVNMPLLDGFEATHKIRKLDPPKAKTPIIALTGSISPDEKEKCLASGMDWYLTKPVYLPELLNVLAKFAPEAKVDNRGYAFKYKEAKPNKENLWLDMIAIETLVSEIEKDDILTLFKDFFVYAEELIIKIKQSATDCNYEKVRIQTHGFKSSSASVGLIKFSELNGKIELECKKQNYKLVKSLCLQLDDVYQKSITELIKQYLIFICN